VDRAGNQVFTTRRNNGSDVAWKVENFAAGCCTIESENLMPRVLGIDDQSDVRAMISIVLRINHFEIVEAASAVAALKAFEEQGFDLAIVDIFLQGTNGSDLIGALRERMPDLPVIAISGMTALDFLSESPGLSNVICLQKPFRPHDLMRAVDAARGSVSPSAVAAL
jgi:DNA-binding NtrC family response regulator